MKKSILILVVGAITVAFNSIADEIKGNLSFIKKPAFTGIIYVPADNSDKKTPIVDQKGKGFTSNIVVGSPEGVVTFKNSDSFDHNVYASDRRQNVKFDVGLMTPNNSTQLNVDWSKDTLVRIGCKIHPKMRSYIANIDSEHFHAFEFQKKVKEYEFTIQNVPTDADSVMLMMPKYPVQTISIKKGESKTIEIKRKNKVKAILNLVRQ